MPFIIVNPNGVVRTKSYVYGPIAPVKESATTTTEVTIPLLDDGNLFRKQVTKPKKTDKFMFNQEISTGKRFTTEAPSESKKEIGATPADVFELERSLTKLEKKLKKISETLTFRLRLSVMVNAVFIITLLGGHILKDVTW